MVLRHSTTSTAALVVSTDERSPPFLSYKVGADVAHQRRRNFHPLLDSLDPWPKGMVRTRLVTRTTDGRGLLHQARTVPGTRAAGYKGDGEDSCTFLDHAACFALPLAVLLTLRWTSLEVILLPDALS
jgi:hypothetical protein